MNISVKKFSKKSLSLLIALIMVFSALPFTPPISADAATQTMTFSYKTRGYIAGHNGANDRYDKISTSTPSINICNDGEASNFCAGFWNYTFSSRPSGRITVTSAKVNLNVLKIENQIANVSVYAVGNSLTSTNSVSTAQAALNLCTKKVKIGTFSNSSIGGKELDCKEAITTMLNEDWEYFNLLLVIENYGSSTGGGNGWTDTHVQQPTLSVTIDVVDATIITANDIANSTTNRVKIGDAIYTYGSSAEYYNYGKTISTESDWNTPISTTHTIRKVECLDDGSILTVSNNKLSGTFYDNKFKVSENTNVNATLKFTFSDGKIEYHKVAVKSYPVQNHVSAAAEKSAASWFDSTNSTDFTMFLRDSTGSGGSGVWKYEKSYYTSGTTGHGFPDRDNNTYTADKNAYVFKYQLDGEAKTNVSKATYFIDKSCRNTSWATLGNSELWDGNNYSITVDVVRTKFFYDLGGSWNNILQMVPTNNYTYSVGNANNTNGTTYTLKYTYNQSVSESNRYSPSNTSDTECNLRFALNTTTKGFAVLRTNMVVNLFDKSVARNLYINYLNENKVSNDYTADSFAAYQNALLDMEAYLSNYEDTTSATTSQAVYTNLVNAHNNLKARNYTVTFQRLADSGFDMVTVETVTVEPGKTVAQSAIPANKDYKYDNNKGNQHYHYYWKYEVNDTNQVFDSSVVINSDIVVTEISKFVACSGGTATCQALAVCKFCNHTYGSLGDHTGGTATCTSKPVCTVCGQEYGETLTHTGGTATCTQGPICELCGEEYGSRLQHSFEINSLDLRPITVAPDGDNNGYKYFACQNCETEDPNSVSLRIYDDQSEYWNTYRDLLTQAKDKIAENNATNGAKYNSDTINALNEAIARVTKVGDEKKSQTYIENENTILQTAITAVKLNQYSITLNYVDENSNDLGTDTITNVDYGTIKDVIAKTTFKDKDNKDKDYVVYKWTRSTQDGDKLLGLNSTSVSVNVIGNLTYYVHLKSTQAESSTDTAVVTLNNKAGKPVDVGYVTTNAAQDVVVKDNTIKIGTTTLTAPQYSFYDIKGFRVNGELITTDSGTKSITVTENMSIIPLYSATPFIDITRNSGEKFTINGKNIDSYSAKWDELITLETTDEVIWYTTENNKDVVLGEGRIFKFRANENIVIYTKQVGDSLTPNSRVGYFGYDADLKKVTIVNNFFVPGRANEYVKAGVVVSTKAKKRDEMIAQYNAGSLKFEGGYDKFTADKNQIRITINRNGTGTRDFSMWALSYVIVDGTTYFADDVISYTYNSQSTTA